LGQLILGCDMGSQQDVGDRTAPADAIRAADGLILVTPEYHFCIRGALKTAPRLRFRRSAKILSKPQQPVLQADPPRRELNALGHQSAGAAFGASFSLGTALIW
jgi:hypothetical protein